MIAEGVLKGINILAFLMIRCVFSDNVAPTAAFCVSCMNPNSPTVAEEGDVIQISILASEPITVPSVTCADGAVVFTVTSANADQTQFVATYTVDASAPEGELSCVVQDFFDLTAGNPGTAAQLSLSECTVTIGASFSEISVSYFW